MTLRLFFGVFCYVLGTKLGALPLRMRHKAMQLVLGRLAGHKTEMSIFLSRVSEVRLGPFLVFFCCGHKIRWCFAVADASQSHAACAWQARWLQN